jgi:ferritin-like metal-binding protein YciE
MKVETLQELYAKELQDLYGSEKLLVKWLAKMAETADMMELRQALSNHVNEARVQTTRIEKIFQLHGERPVAKQGKALEGILREAEDDIAEANNPNIRDAMIVAAIQQAKHFEIAAYSTLQSYAIHLGHNEAARILQTTLQEERAMERKLSELALNHVRVETARPV